MSEHGHEHGHEHGPGCDHSLEEVEHGHEHGPGCDHGNEEGGHGHGHGHAHEEHDRTGDDIAGDGGVLKTIITEGDASQGTPPPGSKVTVHYVGKLLDGSKFDSSRDRAGFFEFTIGQGSVISGWDTGVATMHKGEKATLICRSDYAYGASGSPPKIPGGATLDFEVELFSWKEAAAARSPTLTPSLSIAPTLALPAPPPSSSTSTLALSLAPPASPPSPIDPTLADAPTLTLARRARRSGSSPTSRSWRRRPSTRLRVLPISRCARCTPAAWPPSTCT